MNLDRIIDGLAILALVALVVVSGYLGWRRPADQHVRPQSPPSTVAPHRANVLD